MMSLNSAFKGRLGTEMGLLSGDKSSLSENRGIEIMMEIWSCGLKRSGTNASEIINFLNDLGFEARTTGNHYGTLYRASDLDTDNMHYYCDLLISRRAPY